MKTVLYYFTGTGNSLAVAEGLSRKLGDCELVPIASLAVGSGPVVPSADRVGIVTPIYFFGLPSLVLLFAGRLDIRKVKYIFAVVTMGGSGGIRGAAAARPNPAKRSRWQGTGRGLYGEDAGELYPHV
jgi:hypothetical protein